MRTFGAAALLMVVALTAGCSSGTSASGGGSKKGGGPSREVNKSLTLAQDEGTAVVTLVSVFESYQPEDTTEKPKSGNFIALDLRFDHKAGGYEINPLYFRLRGAEGKIISTRDGNTLFALPSEKTFHSGPEGTLTPGKSIPGMVAFDAKYAPDSTLLAVDVRGVILGQWPLSGADPVSGDGATRKPINKSLTHKLYGSESAVVTLVSVAESKGGVESRAIPISGSFVVAELKFEGKTGEYMVNERYLALRKPDGTLVKHDEGNGDGGVAATEDFGTATVGPGKTATGKVAFDTKLEPGSKLVLTDARDKTVGEWPL